jgi:hypothetical protein
MCDTNNYVLNDGRTSRILSNPAILAEEIKGGLEALEKNRWF